MTTRKRTPGGIPASALAANISAGATSLTLTTGTGASWPSTFPFDIIINRASSTSRERITVGGRTTDTLNSLTRGIDGTTAQAHNLGDTVEVAVAGSYLDELGQLLGGTAGDLYYYDGTALQKLAKGTAEQMLKQGASAPAWSWQALPKFASTSARTTADAAPSDGDASYLNAGDATEGPEFYNGTAWRKPWNMPWGVLSYVQVVANQGSITTIANLTSLTSTVTYVGNRRVRVTAQALFSSTVNTDQVELHVRESTTTLNQANTAAVGGAGATGISPAVLTPSAGSHTYLASAARGFGATGTVTMNASGTFPAYLLVEDLGPSGAPA